MKRQSKLTPQQELQAASEQQMTPLHSGEFANADEALRYDAEQTPVPPEVAQRLQKSLGSTVAARGSWWRTLFGK